MTGQLLAGYVPLFFPVCTCHFSQHARPNIEEYRGVSAPIALLLYSLRASTLTSRWRGASFTIVPLCTRPRRRKRRRQVVLVESMDRDPADTWSSHRILDNFLFYEYRFRISARLASCRVWGSRVERNSVFVKNHFSLATDDFKRFIRILIKKKVICL